MMMKIVISIYIGLIQGYSLKKFRSYNLIKELITFQECKHFPINIILVEILKECKDFSKLIMNSFQKPGYFPKNKTISNFSLPKKKQKHS